MRDMLLKQLTSTFIYLYDWYKTQATSAEDERLHVAVLLKWDMVHDSEIGTGLLTSTTDISHSRP